MSDARLTFQTLALRRELPSDHCERLYDLRREVDEQILVWRPVEAPLRTAARAGDAREPSPALERIVELELAKLRLRPGVVARNLELAITPGARARLAQLGHDPRLGARPLRRTLEDLVVARSPSASRASPRGATPL